MSDISAMVAAVLIFGAGFASATFLGVSGHPWLAAFVLLILAGTSIRSSKSKVE